MSAGRMSEGMHMDMGHMHGLFIYNADFSWIFFGVAASFELLCLNISLCCSYSQ